MTSIQERYEIARNSSNLKSLERTTFSDSDVLVAAGMAAQQNEDALLLWSVAFQGHSADKHKLVENLARKLDRYLDIHRLDGSPTQIAMECVAWLLHGTCQPCGGRGYKTIPGTPHLSDDLCDYCHGTGKVELPRTEAHDWLKDHIDTLTAVAGGFIMQKLAGELDL